MPAGEYFTDYSSRIGLLRWRIEKIAFVLLIPIPFLVPFLFSGGTMSLLTHLYIFGVAVLGLNVIVGYAGEIVLAQGALMAVGAYTTAQLVDTTGFIPAIIVGGIIAGFISFLFGLPSFRVKGFYIAITTLALQFLGEWFFSNRNAEWLHGGAQQALPREVGLVGDFGILSGGTRLYWFTLIVLMFFAVISMNLSRTGYGRSFRAVNHLYENDVAAAVLGVNLFRTKLVAFALGGFMIGVAGGMFGFFIGFLDPQFYTILLTLEHYVMLLVGGLGRVWGAVIGTIVIGGFQDEMRDLVSAYVPDLSSLEAVFFGVLIIVVLVIEPRGIIAALGQIKEYLRNWPYAY